MEHKKHKPQSFLQDLNRVVQYAIYFRLHYFSGYSIRQLHTSAHTQMLIRQHDEIILQLKKSLKADYERQKSDILYKRSHPL